MATYKEDDVKLLFALAKFAEGTPPVAEIAAYMGLKKGATAMRIRRLLERLDGQFVSAAAPAGPAAVAAPAAPVHVHAPAPKKRKKAVVKDEDDEDDEDDENDGEDDDEGEAKKKLKK